MIRDVMFLESVHHQKRIFKGDNIILIALPNKGRRIIVIDM
jgi:hypothetical protein